MGRWLASRLMKELELVSCQQPVHRHKQGGQDHTLSVMLKLSCCLIDVAGKIGK